VPQLTVRDTAVWVRYGDGSVSESAWDRLRLGDLRLCVVSRSQWGSSGWEHRLATVHDNRRTTR